MTGLTDREPRKVGTYDEGTPAGKIEYALMRLGMVGPLETAEAALEALDALITDMGALVAAVTDWSCGAERCVAQHADWCREEQGELRIVDRRAVSHREAGQ